MDAMQNPSDPAGQLDLNLGIGWSGPLVSSQASESAGQDHPK
jgi:hypothetical protein